MFVIIAGHFLDIGRIVPVGESPLVVGRDPDADVCLNDDQVSRRHITIGEVMTMDRRKSVQVTDLKSTNGTFVNGRKIQTTWCCIGETITVGTTTFLFRLQDIKSTDDTSDSLQLVSRDPLTGIYNRRAFDNMLQVEQRRIEPRPGNYCVLMIDLDNLKSVNDELGHPAGDAILKSVAFILSSNVRKTDFVARVGGDEFAVLAPDSDQNQGRRLAERLQESVGFLKNAGIFLDISVSLSIGIAGGSLDEHTLEDYYALADTALLKAKKEGRNRIAFFFDPDG